jgi:ribosomal protein S18 acetylase RimI-like enzyme
VLPAFRGQGLAIKMMDRIEQIAREKGCCKITLEVLSGNAVAQSLYQKVGFEAYALSEDAGQAEFWQKQLVSHH